MHLVIDSIAFKDTQVWADENGSPHSDALHVVERWTPSDADQMHVGTFDRDLKFYSKRFHYTRTWIPGRAWAIGRIHIQRKQRRSRALGFGPGPIRPNGSRG
jgi:hypothetical protein